MKLQNQSFYYHFNENSSFWRNLQVLLKNNKNLNPSEKLLNSSNSCEYRKKNAKEQSRQKKIVAETVTVGQECKRKLWLWARNICK